MKIRRWLVGLLTILLIVGAVYISENHQPTLATNTIDLTPPLPTILVDAGHGGMDTGTSGHDGTAEKDLNLAIAFRLKELLQGCGFRVIMTRENDALIGAGDAQTIRGRKQQDLSARLALTESESPCVLLSIHQNHYTDGKYDGAQVFYTPNHEENQLLAKAIQNRIRTHLQPNNDRKVKTVGSEIYLLHHCQNPAVMVECGFMSNEKELSYLKEEEYQSKMAFCIAMGLFDCYL